MANNRTPDLNRDAWERVLVDRLQHLVPVAERFWANVANIDVNRTGSFPLPGEEDSKMMVRITRAASKSPIKGIQAFPFLPADELRVSLVPGGYKRMIKKVLGEEMELDGMKILEVENCRNTYTRGTVIAFIPPERLETRWERWMYLTRDDAWALARGAVPKGIQIKANKWVKDYIREKKKWAESR